MDPGSDLNIQQVATARLLQHQGFGQKSDFNSPVAVAPTAKLWWNETMQVALLEWMKVLSVGHVSYHLNEVLYTYEAMSTTVE